MEKLINLRWSKILAILFMAVVGLRFLVKFKTITKEQSINLIYLFLFLVMVRFFVEIYINVKNRHQNKKAGIFEYFPVEIVSFFIFQGVLIKNFMQWVMRQEYIPIALPGKKISYMKNSQYQTAFVIMLLALVVEIPIDMFLLGFFLKDENTRIIVRSLITIISFYMLFFVLADRRKVFRDAHFLSEKVLILRISDRFFIDIAIDSVLEVRLFNEDIYKWRRANGIAAQNILLVSPCIYTDKPNVLIRVEKKQNTIIHRCEEFPDVQYVLVFVDEPLALTNDILNRTKKSVEFDAKAEPTL